jgi:hypothetical protein
MRNTPAGVTNVEVLVAAGSTQTDATAIPIHSSPALVVAAGDDIVGIRLPVATKGKLFYVKNTGTGGLTGKLNVYPATSDSINALAINAPIQMATLTSAVFIARNSSVWYTVSLLPS